MFLIAIAIAIILLTIIYKYYTRKFDYWSSRGVRGPKPMIFFGTLHHIFKKPLCELNFEYNETYGKIYGNYIGTRPVLNIGDVELIKDIAIKDFHLFVDHNDFTTGDPLNDKSLFNARGDEWKRLRSIISPTFTSGKMRRMHPLIGKCVQRLVNELSKAAEQSNNEIDVKNFMENLTMDVIASCAFAMEIDTHNDPNNQFVKYAKLAMEGNWRLWAFFILKFAFPKLLTILNFGPSDPNAINFFRTAMRMIIQKRKTDKTGKYADFLQLMIDAESKTDSEELEDKDEIFGETERKDIYSYKSKGSLTEDEVLATSFLFFVAGFETTASLLSFLFYSLATEPECQEKLYKEIEECGQSLDYETLSKLPYLNACIEETLRKYSPLSAIGRLASEDYKLGDTGITIPKGMLVSLNIAALHFDPQYYPNPHKFDPERFMPENKDKLTPYTYMPFGMGPRNCVGMRFALMEAKTAAAHIIKKFKFVPTNNTKIPLEFKKLSILLHPTSNVIGVVKRN